jgi:hypothetical protein
LRRLTGAGTKPQVRFLRKVRVREGSLGEARLVYDAVFDPAIVNGLRHLAQISMNMLSLMMMYPRLAQEDFTPAIAAKLSECEASGPESVRGLHRTLRELARERFSTGRGFRAALAASLREFDDPPPRRPARPPSLDEVCWEPATFPPPPLPGTDSIVPITTLQQLEAEGRIQRHCVVNYARAVCAGQVYFYRVLRPQRATLEVKLSGGKPELGEFKRAANLGVGSAAIDAVEAWFTAARAKRRTKAGSRA